MYRTANYSKPGGRQYNEDYIEIVGSDQGSICMVVADGLGGHGGGDRASQMACHTITGSWDGTVSPQYLEDLLQKAHEAIHEIQTEDCAMKSTAVTLTVQGAKVVWGHVGDSRLYYFHNGELAFRTQDHSVSQLAVDMGEITADQIRFHEDRNRLLRALGMDGDVTVEIGQTTLVEGQHAFLLCTDGFWEYVLEEEMEQFLRTAESPQDWLRAMHDLLMGRINKGSDNHSAAVMWMKIDETGMESEI